MNKTYLNTDLTDKRIAVLLSGGVDSSVVVYELAQRGLHPDCFYIKIGPEQEEEWDCTSEEDLEMATAVARRFECKLEVVDCHKEYWDQVTRYTMDKVRAGFTPNPDVMCNRLIKFGAFHEKRGKDYDLIATGHYAQTEEDEEGRKWLVTSPDPVKDQTDFLAQIYDWQLRKALFPIGHYQKGEVREIAEREHLINAKRKDSQGICFLGKINYNDYIRRYLGEAFVGRQQMFERRVGTQQLLLYGAVPSPWCNLQVVAHVGRYVLKVGWCDESYVVGVALHVAHPFECSLYVVYQYHVAIVCPQRRQKSKVGAQLASGMRSCETGLVGRKGNVVFGIEYMEFHFF